MLRAQFSNRKQIDRKYFVEAYFEGKWVIRAFGEVIGIFDTAKEARLEMWALEKAEGIERYEIRFNEESGWWDVFDGGSLAWIFRSKKEAENYKEHAEKDASRNWY